MKRNHHQITSKNSRNSAASQSKTASKAAQGRARKQVAKNHPQCSFWPYTEEDYPSCLCVFDCEAGDVVSRIPLSSDEFCAALMETTWRKIEFEQWIAAAIREKLRGSCGEAAWLSRGGLTAIIQYPDGRLWCRAEFNSSERRRIEAATKAAGLTLPEFFRNALQNRLVSTEGSLL
jgi:hypothetical protein